MWAVRYVLMDELISDEQLSGCETGSCLAAGCGLCEIDYEVQHTVEAHNLPLTLT